MSDQIEMTSWNNFPAVKIGMAKNPINQDPQTPDSKVGRASIDPLFPI